jgi:hypothetical protein
MSEIDKAVNKFKEEYRRAYKGILSDEVLEKGNEWFENELRQALVDCEARMRKKVNDEWLDVD